MGKLILKANNTIKKYQMLHPGDIIIVAVSGGADSLCLLDVLNRIKERLKLSLIVAHVNHGIRIPEAKLEADFVRLKARKMNIPFEQLTVSVPAIAKEKSLSLEQAGRKVRYKFLEELCKKYQAKRIAFGHHADDQIETILMRLIRGSGLQGLKGIPPKRDKFIRPLIECTRQEIESYCLENNINYCIDSTNKDPMYLRNKIRHQLIPLLANEYNSSICSNLIKLQTIVQDELDYWEKNTEQYFSDSIIEKHFSEIVLDIRKIKKYPIALQRRIVRKGIGWIRTYLADIDFYHIESIRQLCLLNRGEKYIDLPDNIRIRKSYQRLEIGQIDNINNNKNKQDKKFGSWEYDLPLFTAKEYPKIGMKITTRQYEHSEEIRKKYLKNTNSSEAYLDYDKLHFPLKIRNRRTGDRFKPLNCEYFKKIKSFFIDKKIPLHKRDLIALIVDKSDNIVWVTDFQPDNRFKITKNTKKILYIKKGNLKKKKAINKEGDVKK